MKMVAQLCSFALLACAAATSFGRDGKLTFPAKKAATNDATVELKGKLLQGSQPLQFKTDAGIIYTLVSNRLSSALFVDTNLVSKTLLLKGQVQPERRFEVTGNLRSFRDGKIYELYYYCDICAIKGIDPGPCMCCREPVHLVEAPAK